MTKKTLVRLAFLLALAGWAYHQFQNIRLLHGAMDAPTIFSPPGRISAISSKVKIQSPEAATWQDFGLPYRGRSWESSKVLPAWMKEYFAWHQATYSKLSHLNWRQFRFLRMRCLDIDGKCGGAADRLRPVVFAVLVAAQTKRILLIQWEKPATLEHFLVPPQDGIDWRVPEWLSFNNTALADIPNNLKLHNINKTGTLLDMRYQAADYGSQYYNEHCKEGEPSFREVFHDCWSVLFEPSAAVTELIAKAKDELGLRPSTYASVHIRSLYELDKTDDVQMVQNAIQCASQLQPHAPIFVASDSRRISESAIAYGQEVGLTVVARLNGTIPLHLERGTVFLSHLMKTWTRQEPSAYYDAFVDLYLLAGGRCTAFNRGGYGSWSNLLSVNTTCAVNHHKVRCVGHD